MTLTPDGPTLFGLLLVFATVVNLASIGFWLLVERLLNRRKRIYDVPLRDGQVARELLGNGLFVLIFAGAMTLVFSSGRIEVASLSWGAATITFLGAMISFDLYYYALHYTMHTRTLAPIHDWHHQSRVNTPWSALSMSPVESALWLVGLALWPVLTAGALPFAPEAYFAWLVFFWFSNTMGHINVEIVPPEVSASPVSRWMSHAITYHALHHSRVQKHYCFFLNSLDMLLGQVWADYPEKHAQVAGGQPMTRLGERGADATPSA